MAGHGFAPKDPSKRARTNADPVPLRVIQVKPSGQPELPTSMDWPERTVSWWRMWGSSPLSTDYTETDWDFLLDTALLHALYWTGDTRLAGELRLRVAKYGATPEDRARLRITFATADVVEDRREASPSSRERRGPLTATG